MATGVSGYVDFAATKDFTFRVWYEQTYDIATNKSVVTLTKIQVKTGTWHLHTTYLNGTIAVDGVTVVTMNSVLPTHEVYLSENDTWLDVSGTLGSASDIEHAADGSKEIVIAVDVAGYTASGKYSNGWKTTDSASIELATIPRASDITSAAGVTLGNRCSIKWTPKALTFRYKLRFSLGGWSYTTGAIHPNQTSDYTYTGYTIPLTVAEQITDADTGTMTVKLYTYSDSGATNQVGDEASATFKVTVPDSDSTRPTVSMTLTAESSLADTFNGLYIQGKTKVQAELSATGKYDATIESYNMKVDGAIYDSGDDYTSDFLANAGTITVYGYAKDSRGNTGSTSKEITVIAYSKPKIVAASDESEVVAARCDADGNLSDSGTYLKIKAKRSYSPVNSGDVQYNFCEIRYRYKLESAESYSAWVTILAGDSMDSDEIVTGALLGGVLSAENSYLVQVQAIDDTGDYGYTTISVPTDKVYMHRDKVRRALAFGMYIQDDNTIDIAEDITVRIRGPLEAMYGNTAVDYVVETGVSDGWTYKKWKGGSYEMFGSFEVTPPDSTLHDTLYCTDNMTIDVPFTISSAIVTGTAVGYYWITNGGISGTDKITLRLISDREFDTAAAIEVRLMVAGTYA